MPSPLSTRGRSSSGWTPTRAAIIAPVAVPTMMRGSRPRRYSALTTPRWQRPKMAPPWSTSAVFPKPCLVSWMKSSLVWVDMVIIIMVLLPSLLPSRLSAGDRARAVAPVPSRPWPPPPPLLDPLPSPSSRDDAQTGSFSTTPPETLTGGSAAMSLIASEYWAMYSSMRCFVPPKQQLNSFGQVMLPRLRTSPARSKLMRA
ncbi:hypothetical protein VTK26DRAFT_2855 [Humicola hyalothermophila]